MKYRISVITYDGELWWAQVEGRESFFRSMPFGSGGWYAVAKVNRGGSKEEAIAKARAVISAHRRRPRPEYVRA